MSIVSGAPLQVKTKIKRAIPFWLGFILGFWFITLNITGHSFAFYPGDLGDARFNNYILEHDYRFFIRQDDSFWNAPFMYPESSVVTLSDNLVGTAPLYGIFRILGMDRETAFQGWYIILVFLNYSCCYCFLVKLFGNRYSAVLGAMIFAFSMALQSQLTHAQTFARFPVPLTFLAAMLFIKELKPKYFFLTILILVYQLYCGIYLGLMLSVPVTILLISCFIYRKDIFFRRVRSINWIIKISVALALNAALALIIMLPYYIRSKGLGYYGYEETLHSIPTVKSFLYSKPGTVIWKFLQNLCDNYQQPWDHQLFPGGVAILCFIISMALPIYYFLAKKKPFLQSELPLLILLITALMTFLGFLRIQTFSLYKFVSILPGFGSMRAIHRIINIHLLFFAIAVAFTFSLILKKMKRGELLLFLAAALIIIADNYYPEGASYTTLKRTSQERVNRLVQEMSAIPKGSIISCETDKQQPDMIACQLDVMLAAQTLGLKCINGYSGYSPHGYSDFWTNMNAAAREKWIAYKNLNPDLVRVVKY